MAAALLLAWNPNGLDPAALARFEDVSAAMPRRVREMTADDTVAPRLRLRAWSHALAFSGAPPANGSPGVWLTAVGNPTRADLSDMQGHAALGRLLAECRQTFAGTVETLSPPFALVYSPGDEGPIEVAVDRAGVQHLYLRSEADGTIWIGSSSLALAQALGATVDEDATAEWLAAGHFVSQRTFAREVRKLAPGERLELGVSGCVTRATWQPPAQQGAAADADYRTAFLDALEACHAGAGTAAELTGGLDSRLVLAGRLERGLPTLSWTLGQAGCEELRTVERLRLAAGFDHIAVSLNGSLSAAIPGLTCEMHDAADGEVNALEYAPLLVAFAKLQTRRRVSVSGSGGEIARGYYAAAASGGAEPSVAVRTLVRKLSGATAPARGALRADLFPDPLEPLTGAVERFLEAASTPDAAGLLDDFYVRARMQRFAGRNITTTGLYCRQALPFFGNSVVDASFGLPAARKRQGRVVRDAVAAWAPELARIPLDSGMAVAARSWRTPGASARWTAAMARKAMVRYGGGARGLAPISPEVVPWGAVRRDPGFRQFVTGLLLDPEATRVHRLLDPARTSALVTGALAGGPLYPLGLVLSLELTLRRLDGAAVG